MLRIVLKINILLTLVGLVFLNYFSGKINSQYEYFAIQTQLFSNV